jgi:hypothetical protein
MVLKIKGGTIMKKLSIVSIGMVFLFILSMNAHAGMPIGAASGTALPHSKAYGKSLDEWMEVYLRWIEDFAPPDARVNNVAFIDVFFGTFDIEVEPGTAFVLPVVAWIGAPNDPEIPDEWWGDSYYIDGEVWLNGEMILEINGDYYVGPTELDPPLFGFYPYYQALACLINPLPPGEHELRVVSYFHNIPPEYNVEPMPLDFDNTWTIKVLP